MFILNVFYCPKNMLLKMSTCSQTQHFLHSLIKSTLTNPHCPWGAFLTLCLLVYTTLPGKGK